jgi:hypothetical protein
VEFGWWAFLILDVRRVVRLEVLVKRIIFVIRVTPFRWGQN